MRVLRLLGLAQTPESMAGQACTAWKSEVFIRFPQQTCDETAGGIDPQIKVSGWLMGVICLTPAR